MTAAYIIIAVIALGALSFVVLYNDIIRKKNEVDYAFGSLDAMLKKRFDLIPNLVETVHQYMIHEASILSAVTKLRSQYHDELSNEDKVELHNDLSKKFNSIFVSVENYPDLKASKNFLKLQAAWNEIEEQISASRRYFNSTVADYNNSIQTFPSNLIAQRFNFKEKKIFTIAENERANINAKELFK